MSEERRDPIPGSWEEALVAAEEAVRASPEDPRANFRVGWLLGKLERYAEAVVPLSAAVRADPELAEAWYYLGLASVKTGSTNAAREALERFEALAAEDAQGLGQRANLRRQLGEPETAEAYARRALDLGPDRGLRVWVHRVLAGCHEDLGRHEDRLCELESAVREDPDDPRLLAELAQAEYVQGRAITVVPVAEGLVARRPDDAEAWYALGAVASRDGNWGRAVEALERAIDLGFNPAEARRELGGALFELGQYSLAIAELEAAVEATGDTSTFCWLHERLARAYHELGDRGKTLEHYGSVRFGV